MNNLDDPTLFRQLDRGFAADSIGLLDKQCLQAWEETSNLKIPDNYRQLDNIVISGMGGSTYGARIVKSLYDGASLTKIPVEIANNYWLPGYVGPKTLVILSSYSGTTEETLATAVQARIKGAKITGITTGGALKDFLRQNNYPGYIFDPIHNPSKQPRIGVGYMVMGLIGILARLNLVPVGTSEVKHIADFLNESNKSLSVNSQIKSNQAKKHALELYNKIPIIMVADFLEGAAYAVRNPFHETAKQFALYFSVPELNHHLLEGLTYPSDSMKKLIFIFVRSKNYDSRNSRRLELTEEIIRKNKLSTLEVVLSGYSTLSDSMEFIQLGSWVSYYLAMLNNADPTKIPWVDYFKQKLSAAK